MNIKHRGSDYLYLLEVLKWIAVVMLLIVAGIFSYIYRNYSLLYRVTAIFFIIAFASYLALLTRYGKFVIIFSTEAIAEVRKVIWPTFRESAYTTLIIVIVTIIMSMILWGLDSVLVYLVSLSLGL